MLAAPKTLGPWTMPLAGLVLGVVLAVVVVAGKIALGGDPAPLLVLEVLAACLMIGAGAAIVGGLRRRVRGWAADAALAFGAGAATNGLGLLALDSAAGDIHVVTVVLALGGCLALAMAQDWTAALAVEAAAAAASVAAVISAVLFVALGPRTAGADIAMLVADAIVIGACATVLVAGAIRASIAWPVAATALLATAHAATLVAAGIVAPLLATAIVVLLVAAARLPETPRRVAPTAGLALSLGLLAIAVAAAERAGGLGNPHAAAAAWLGAALAFVAVGAAALGRYRARPDAVAEGDPLTGLADSARLRADLTARISAPGGGDTILILLDLVGFKEYNDLYGRATGDALLRRLARRLAAVGDGYRLPGDEFALISSFVPDDAGRLIDNALRAVSEEGDGFRVCAVFGAVLLPEEAGTASAALRVADQRLAAQRCLLEDSGSDERMTASQRLILADDREAHPHILDLADLAIATARRLDLGDAMVLDVVRAAQLHDVGKLAIPDAVLSKQQLDDGDWDLIRRHPIIGERILAANPQLAAAARLVRASHERWDGAGYPDGLAGAQIPLGARIVAACDAFAAMVGERPHAVATASAAALAELARCAGTQFDPEVVAALTEAVRAGEVPGRRDEPRGR